MDWGGVGAFYGLPLKGVWDGESSQLTTMFTVFQLPSRRILKRYDFAWSAVHAASIWKADLIYTWTLQAALIAQYRGIPVVLEMHDLPTGRLGPWMFLRFINGKGKKRLLVITTALRERLEKIAGRPFTDSEVQIAPNGTDLERYNHLPEAAEARRQLGLPEGVTVGYTGHFYSGRGMNLLLGLAQKFPQTRFLWVGGTPQAVATWQTRLNDAGVKNVTLTGFIENRLIPLYQAAADVLLMPYETSISGSSGGNSAEICSPMKMFDYLASGRAIISSDLPVLHEVLNQRNAVFCPPNDLSAWQKALAELLANPEKCLKLASQAQRDAASYTWRGRAAKALQSFFQT